MPDENAQLVLIGAGGFAREVLELIEDINLHGPQRPRLDVLGLLDDGDPDLGLLEPFGAPLLGPVSQLQSLPADIGYVIAVGDPATRKQLALELADRTAVTLVHPTALVGRQVHLGAGTIVCGNASVTTNVRTGSHVHVNINCTVGHDVVIGDYATLSPQTAISGGVVVGEGAFFGTGCAVNPRLTVGPWSVIGSLAAVVKDVERASTVAGVPARPLASRQVRP